MDRRRFIGPRPPAVGFKISLLCYRARACCSPGSSGRSSAWIMVTGTRTNNCRDIAFGAANFGLLAYG